MVTNNFVAPQSTDTISGKAIQKTVRCQYCSGKGEHTIFIDPVELWKLRAECQGHNNKINFIKEIRAKWDLPLIEAKDIAESCSKFIESQAQFARRRLNE